MIIKKVISGGQSGIDRAALDAARMIGVETGGFAPVGLMAEDGPISADYGLTQVSEHNLEASLSLRTRLNVLASDTTLILHALECDSPGTTLTLKTAESHAKPYRAFQLEATLPASGIETLARQIAEWLVMQPGSTLNIAGPRESEAGLYSTAFGVLKTTFVYLKEANALTIESSSDFERGQSYRQELITLFTHWDNIRWQGPAWLTGSVAVVGSLLSSSEQDKWTSLTSHPLFLGITLSLVGFSAVSAILQANLISYHRYLQKAYHEHIATLLLSEQQRLFLLRRLPFTFAGFAVLKTASFWLLIYTLFLSLLIAAPTLWGAYEFGGSTGIVSGGLVALGSGMILILLGTEIIWCIVRLVRQD